MITRIPLPEGIWFVYTFPDGEAARHGWKRVYRKSADKEVSDLERKSALAYSRIPPPSWPLVYRILPTHSAPGTGRTSRDTVS